MGINRRGFLTRLVTGVVGAIVANAIPYGYSELNVPFTWSAMPGPSDASKIALVKSLMENALNTMDDEFEAMMFDPNWKPKVQPFDARGRERRNHRDYFGV